MKLTLYAGFSTRQTFNKLRCTKRVPAYPRIAASRVGMDSQADLLEQACTFILSEVPKKPAAPKGVGLCRPLDSFVKHLNIKRLNINHLNVKHLNVNHLNVKHLNVKHT
ncbi:hypothetical protein ACFSR7_33045 [Cohnella sp. GCM10020058]|uniref:hypothetical protein n=1 Tax=Cohnella sp. GCM10020058 TaxID=3317330 RepID=UPI00363C7F5F